MIKLIGIDVDGTLLDSRGQIPAENLAACHEAASRGIHIAIVTGRSFYFALQAVATLADPLILIVHNGAIARTRGGDTLTRRLMPRDLAREVLTATLSWRASAVVLFDRPLAGQMVYDKMDWAHPDRKGFRARNRPIIEQVESLEEALTEDPIQVGFNGGVESMRAIVAQLQAHPSAPALSVSVTEYPERNFSLVDVFGAGVSKGTGLAQLAASLDVEQA
ncbi:MAG: HAD family phosphatase, partial [Acidobacteria bacterium]|nr:HAD family phosphatase [Acidobacteriota bacterium]